MEQHERDPLTQEIIGAAIEVHREMGPGLLESAYETCLADELGRRRIRFQRQVEVPIRYKGRQLECGYRLDLLVEETVIVELKCVEAILKVHEAQLMTYLRLTRKEVGLIINFNVPMLREGIVRKASSASASSATLRLILPFQVRRIHKANARPISDTPRRRARRRVDGPYARIFGRLS